MAKDRWDKLETAGKLIAGIFIPVAIFVATYVITQNEKKLSEMHKQSARLTAFITPLGSENPRERLIAVEIANHLALEDQFPSELIPTLLRIAETDRDSEVARTASTAVVSAAEASPDVAKVVESELSSIPPRVYFHIPTESLRSTARNFELKLEEAFENINLIVPGIENRPGPQTSELRYFRANEKDEAKQIADLLKELGLDVHLKDLSAWYGTATNIRPRHYELWFGEAGE